MLVCGAVGMEVGCEDLGDGNDGDCCSVNHRKALTQSRQSILTISGDTGCGTFFTTP